MIRDLCFLLKALTEWQLPLQQNSRLVVEIFENLLKVQDWLDADSMLTNCFLNVLKIVNSLETGRSSILKEIDGKPLLKTILKKTQALSVKPPHTATNLALMKNGIKSMMACAKMIEVRVMLKNSKVFQMLELLHPQIHPTRKSPWDDVAVEWLKFFEFLSRFEDTECLPK